jgi:APA family basic amino acid/polyamine antiporter
VHKKYKTPHVATIVTGVLVGTAAAFASLDEMVDLTNIGTLFAFMLVCIGIMILRVKDPHRERSFRVPGGAFFLPTLGALSCIGLAVYLPPTSWMRFFGWLAVGLCVYFLYGVRHSRLRHPHLIPGAAGPALPDFNPEQQLPEADVHDDKKK